MKKVLSIVLIAILMLTTACSGSDNDLKIDDIRGLNPATIKDDDAYKSPHGKFMYYSDFLKTVEKYATENNYTVGFNTDDYVKDKRIYHETWKGNSTGVEYSVSCYCSGKFIRAIFIDVDDLKSQAGEAEFTNICEFFTNIFNDFEKDDIYRNLNFYDLKTFKQLHFETKYYQYRLNSGELRDEQYANFTIRHLYLGSEDDFT